MKKTHALEDAIAHSRVGRRSRAGVMPWTLRPHRYRSPDWRSPSADRMRLDGLDLEVARGQVHGYLGPKGRARRPRSGSCLGLIGADGGSVRLLGGDPWTDRVRLHRRLAYVPGEVDLWPPSPGRGHRPAGSAAGRARRPPPRRAPRTLRARPHEEGAFPTPREPAEDRARHRPRLRGRLLLLNEPTAGLDPLMADAFRNCIEDERRAGRTVLLSSHTLAEVEALCDHVTIIRNGRVVESGALSDLRHLTRASVSAELDTEPAGLADLRAFTTCCSTAPRSAATWTPASWANCSDGSTRRVSEPSSASRPPWRSCSCGSTWTDPPRTRDPGHLHERAHRHRSARAPSPCAATASCFRRGSRPSS